MFKTLKKAQKGFTIIELLIVIAIIAILALLVLNNFQGAQAKARDQQRTTDINNVHSKLEEFYNENNYYPGSIPTDSAALAALLPGMDEGSIKDPVGNNNITSTVVASASAADSQAAPSNDTTTTSSYAYIVYPTGCDATTPVSCTGYRLKSFIEKPSSTTPNPFVKKSLN